MKIFNLPDLGEGLAEAEIHEWHVKEGEIVKVDQPMVSLETAKAVVEVPSPYAGKIIKLYGKAGDIIQTDAALVGFESDEPSVEKEVEKEKDRGTVVGSLEESSTVLDSGDIIIGAARQTATTVKAMPVVRALAKQLNVDLNNVTPTGPQGQITIEDVKKNTQQKSAPLFQKEGKGTVEALHGVRRAMASAMTLSHQEIVPVTIVDDADLTDLPKEADITVCIIQAMVAGIQAEPSLNAWYDGRNMERCLLSEIHIGLAMDTNDGLFVPVLKDVAKLSPEALRAGIDVYKKSVRARTVAPSDLHGATISLSNFGMIAGRYATPIVVPPMVAILGCGKLRETPVVHDGKIVIRRLLPLSLTFDHRAVTGGEATRFLGMVMQSLATKK